ncbi:MAG TPA: hypothetical protein VL551_03335 [Actinospica sp.]|jgi:hypothetical protein|nr:hypothetical protein [Actinospica sp.]
MVHFLASVSSDSAPPGFFLKLYIIGGFALVGGIAWFVLRGYVKSGDNEDDR